MGQFLNNAKPVGSVQEISGESTITRVDGSVEVIQLGTEVYTGDVIETGANGAVNIGFTDDTSFAVSENAKMAIDEYVFDPVTESGSQNFSMLKGLFVFTSGLIGRDDPDDVMIETPMGSIGIRGTIIAGDVDQGEITVIEGAIVMKDFDGNEVTLANQFETAKFQPGKGIDFQGAKTASDVADRFSSVSKVSPNLFSSINDAAAEAADKPGADDIIDEAIEEAVEGRDTATGEPETQANPDGSLDQNRDNEVDGSIDDSVTEDTQGEAVDGGETTGEGEKMLTSETVAEEAPAESAPKPVVMQTADSMMGSNHSGMGGGDIGEAKAAKSQMMDNADKMVETKGAMAAQVEDARETAAEEPSVGEVLNNDLPDPALLQQEKQETGPRIVDLDEAASADYTADAGGLIIKGDERDNVISNDGGSVKHQDLSIDGGAGNDVFDLYADGNGELHIVELNGGAGDDIFKLQLTAGTPTKVLGNFLHGGGGVDTLKAEGVGVLTFDNVDSVVKELELRGIEKIDLNANGGQVITLGFEHLFSMSNEGTQAIDIFGDGNDVLNLQGGTLTDVAEGGTDATDHPGLDRQEYTDMDTDSATYGEIVTLYIDPDIQLPIA